MNELWEDYSGEFWTIWQSEQASILPTPKFLGSNSTPRQEGWQRLKGAQEPWALSCLRGTELGRALFTPLSGESWWGWAESRSLLTWEGPGQRVSVPHLECVSGGACLSSSAPWSFLHPCSTFHSAGGRSQAPSSAEGDCMLILTGSAQQNLLVCPLLPNVTTWENLTVLKATNRQRKVRN